MAVKNNLLFALIFFAPLDLHVRRFQKRHQKALDDCLLRWRFFDLKRRLVLVLYFLSSAFVSIPKTQYLRAKQQLVSRLS